MQIVHSFRNAVDIIFWDGYHISAFRLFIKPRPWMEKSAGESVQFSFPYRWLSPVKYFICLCAYTTCRTLTVHLDSPLSYSYGEEGRGFLCVAWQIWKEPRSVGLKQETLYPLLKTASSPEGICLWDSPSLCHMTTRGQRSQLSSGGRLGPPHWNQNKRGGGGSVLFPQEVGEFWVT